MAVFSAVLVDVAAVSVLVVLGVAVSELAVVGVAVLSDTGGFFSSVLVGAVSYNRFSSISKANTHAQICINVHANTHTHTPAVV